VLIIPKKIQRFLNGKGLEEFLSKHPDSEIISGEHYGIRRDIVYILSIGNGTVKPVPRPMESPYRVPVVYCVYSDETIEKKYSASPVKTKFFGYDDKMEEINSFLCGKAVEKILIIPAVKLTEPLDNYYCGEFGPVPDRRPVYVTTHQIIIVYKE